MKIVLNKGYAYRIRIALPSNINEYAKAFLAIVNNQRVSSDRLLKVYNDSGNSVYVIVREDCKDDAVDFLEQFGEIKKCEKVLTFEPNVEYMSHNEFNEIFRDDIDTEFLDIVCE